MAKALTDQLTADSQFLCSLGIMDYSLLLGVHSCFQPTSTRSHCHGLKDMHQLERVSQSELQKQANNALMGNPSTSSVPFRRSNSLRRGLLNNNQYLGGFRLESSEGTQLEHINPFPDGVRADVIVGPGIYFMGIIDILQAWTWQKWFERAAKILFKFHCEDADDISAVEPEFYSARFIHMVNNMFETTLE
jgi:1-phosphatidylinositol-4-phosphate 5-kinase